MASAPARTDADDGDWEYEYSTTETETHLISLDLSLPEFVRRRDDLVVHNTRGGFRSWLNPMNLGPSSGRSSLLPRGLRDDAGADADADVDGDSDGDLDEDSDNDNEHGHDAKMQLRGQRGQQGQRDQQQQQQQQQQPEEPDPTEIQILELHHNEPLIAYRGMLFKGAWSEMIGTEMLFAGRGGGGEDHRRLGVPVSPHVDLVGATAARIACTPVEVRPRRDGASSTARKTALAAKPNGGGDAASGGGLGFVIPVGNAASVPRQQQAHFLEQLMALKHQHGEPDVVTVLALDTKQNAVHGDAEEAKRRARRETLLQVHQERRAKRLRESGAESGAGGGGGGPGETTPTGGTPRRARRSRREMSPLATVAGDDELAGVVEGGRAGSDSEGDNDSGG
ncbi:hypothetical protein SCUCBS95973_001449 [Sporothrix curviconia]|uniref:Transcription factor TFIIIC triple barrel domain-containing protein n=1 Tax=Sporothrix curviconia TaxID=1260050 RepID=A0ABP0AYP8_9PEZI